MAYGSCLSSGAFAKMRMTHAISPATAITIRTARRTSLSTVGLASERPSVSLASDPRSCRARPPSGTSGEDGLRMLRRSRLQGAGSTDRRARSVPTCRQQFAPDGQCRGLRSYPNHTANRLPIGGSHGLSYLPLGMPQVGSSHRRPEGDVLRCRIPSGDGGQAMVAQSNRWLLPAFLRGAPALQTPLPARDALNH
jgi:hypothetical protein